MSHNEQGDRLCAGCGRPSCPCTPADVRRQLEKDRAELSDRAAAITRRSLDQEEELVRLRRVAAAAKAVAPPAPITAWSFAPRVEVLVELRAALDALETP